MNRLKFPWTSGKPKDFFQHPHSWPHDALICKTSLAFNPFLWYLKLGDLNKMIQRQAIEQKRKALEPHEQFCYILKKNVTILVEYPDYKNPLNKGKENSIYCSNILPCYHNDVKCKYSGISPLFRDPFVPSNSELLEEKIDFPEESGPPAS